MNKQKTKKSELKLFIIFLAFLAACYVTGYFLGTMGARFEDVLQQVTATVYDLFIRFLPSIYIAGSAIAVGVSGAFYLSARKQAKVWDGEDEDVINAVDRKLNLSVIITNIFTVFNMFFYGAMIYLVEVKADNGESNKVIFWLGTLTFAISYAFITLENKFVLDLVKKLNPEKRGSVFDFNFKKEWESSCDEGEKLCMYKATYKAFHVTNIVCMVMWGAAFVGVLLFDTGLFPMVCVSVIWGAITATYSIECAKEENRR